MDNRRFISEMEEFFSSELPVTLGVNKKNELIRLSYEICRARKLTFSELTRQIDLENVMIGGKSGLFHRLKNVLMEIRYPSLTPQDEPRLLPIKIDRESEECGAWTGGLDPKKILIEKSVRGAEWTDNFVKKFLDVEIVEIKDITEGFKNVASTSHKNRYNLRRDHIFLTKTKSTFIKICPCTKGCRRCGYWILNVGFGCPMDCSYCYLQTYSNAPGIILPANIEDYYEHIESFDRKLKQKIRIGTGEFTDSLAFDEYTAYSTKLVPFFRNMKNLVLELKTKMDSIDNVLNAEPNDNVVISWSVNTEKMAQKYEKGAPKIKDRVEAALLAARRGYKIGFHFDPLIWYDGWKDEYKKSVEELFSFNEIRKNTVWISLGTLRYTPGLKQTAEKRFSDNIMFYQGEFFAESFGKMRYKKNARIDMYNKMISWIRSCNVDAWIYLCMEPEDVWRKTSLSKKDYSFRSL